jgi:ATP-dependent HslUV protease subunit HslV
MRVMTDTQGASPGWHGTTILAVRKDGKTVIAGDGQVSMGQTIVKGNARKVRTLAGGRVVAGFAGATAERAWATCWSRSMRSPPSAQAATTPWPRRGP